MDKIGLKLFKGLDYDEFEPLQYWLDYDVEYEDLLEKIETQEVIELDIEEDEDRAEDIEMLQTFLHKFEQREIAFELYVKREDWEQTELDRLV